MSMVERLIYDVIAEGLAYFTADQGQRFERFLTTELRLDAEEAVKARTAFVERPVHLIHGYARTGSVFPCWALVLGGEQESTTYLNDDVLGYEYDPETGERRSPKQRRVDYTYLIQVISEHPDRTLYLYHLLKRIILSQHDAWLAADLEPPLIGGQDLMPDPRYLPHDFWVRQVTLTITGDENWTEPFEAVGQSVSIAIDDTGDAKTEGDAAASVSAGVTTYTE